MAIKSRKTPPSPLPSSPEDEAERHVEELMGPPQSLDGSKSVEPPTAPPPTARSNPASTDDDDAADAPAAAATAPVLPPVATTPDPDLPASAADTAPDPDTLEEPAPPARAVAGLAEDEATSAAIDDIERAEADAALRDETETADEPVVMHTSFAERLRNAWHHCWQSPAKRYATLAVLLLVPAIVLLVPALRAGALNTLGVRTSLTLVAIDKTNNLPLERVTVRVGSVQAKTDADGNVRLKGLRLGKAEVSIVKAGFAEERRTVPLDVRIADIGEVTLRPVGLQLRYVLTDYLSTRPVAGATLSSGEATTRSNKKGEAVLTLPVGAAATEPVRVEAKGYRIETVRSAEDAQRPATLSLVPAAKHVYVSKETGQYNVYKVDIDGTHKEVLLEASGLEGADTFAAPDPAGKKAAVVSVRDAQVNKDGYPLRALTLIDIASGASETLEHAERIDIVGWQGSGLVYTLSGAAPSAAHTNRQRLQFYDYQLGKRIQLANANYFTGTFLLGSTLYYGVTATDPGMQAGLYRVDTSGGGRALVLGQTLWSVLRTQHDTFSVQTPEKWLAYRVGQSAPTDILAPPEGAGRAYVDAPGGKQSAYVEPRDLKGAVMLYDTAAKKEKKLTEQPYARSVVGWLDERTLVYHVAGSGESADYAVSIEGGTARKIVDVSPASRGIEVGR